MIPNPKNILNAFEIFDFEKNLKTFINNKNGRMGYGNASLERIYSRFKYFRPVVELFDSENQIKLEWDKVNIILIK